MSSVVLDFDTDFIRAGYGGELLPRVEVNVDFSALTYSRISTLLNTIFIDLLQVKLKVYS